MQRPRDRRPGYAVIGVEPEATAGRDIPLQPLGEGGLPFHERSGVERVGMIYEGLHHAVARAQCPNQPAITRGVSS